MSGQGTGWSPPNWAAISDIISDAMDEDTPGMRLVYPDNVTFSVRSFDAFVDDVNGGITSDGMIMYTPKNVNSVPLMQNIFEQIQANVEHYSKLLFTSGGKLALHKCYCYIIEFEWQRGKKHMKNNASLYPPLQVDQSFSSMKENIALLNPSVGRRMLGAISAPNGSTKDQEISLLQKSSTWGQKISKGYLNGYDVSMSFRQGILKALEYPLGVSLLSEKQCDGIMVPIMSPFLRKLGFNSKTPRSIVYGPLQHGGLQVPNLYTSQGIQKIRMFLGHTRKQNRTGTILAIALGVAQQEIGIHIPILESDYETYSDFSSKSWVQCLWQFLHSIHAKIILQNPWVPSPGYKNDVNIMYRVSEMNISKEQKYKVNICRIYLRVYFLWEILDTSKTKLKDNIMNVTYRGYHNDKFPLLPRPPQSFIQVWQSVLRDIIRISNLGRHLGPIISLLSFEWRISECFSILFQYEKNVRTRAYKRSPSTSAYISYSSTMEETVHMDKQDFYVVTMFRKNACHYFVRYLQQIPNKLLHHNQNQLESPTVYTQLTTLSKQHDEEKKFRQLLERKDASIRRIIGCIKSSFHLRELAEALEKHQIIGVGDASVRNSIAGHAYVIETKPPRFHFHAIAPVDCTEEDVTSNRAEGCTILAMLHVIEIICVIFHIKEGSISLFCDNKEAL